MVIAEGDPVEIFPEKNLVQHSSDVSICGRIVGFPCHERPREQVRVVRARNDLCFIIIPAI